MKILVKNLGAIKQAEFTLGELTVICGKNNTGKTYATYALFGFLSFWEEVFFIEVPESDIRHLLAEGSIDLNLETYIKKAPAILKKACTLFTERLSEVFASSDKRFAESHFEVILDPDDIQPCQTFERTMGTAKTRLFSISKKKGSLLVTVSLLVEKGTVKIPQELISRIIGEAVKNILFEHLLPRPFISSAVRTGAAIFRKELNFTRNRLIEEMGSKEKEINPHKLLLKVHIADYALPVKFNVEFTRRLEEVAKKESFILKNHSEILDDFADIIGGNYLVNKQEELYYVPQKKRTQLIMNESSSAVQSLLDIGFYLRHEAEFGDLLMIDEPELNLHPENQRRIARLFSRLIKIGIKVFITTHSDYIIKELNTLIMLNRGGERLEALAEREKYKVSELLDPQKVRVYMAEEARIKLDGSERKTKCQTLIPADIDNELGIEAKCFDRTIDEMNRIQDEIVWG